MRTISHEGQGDHSPGKPGKVGEFQSGQGKWKVRCVFSSSKYSKTRFSAYPLGELTMLPQTL